MSSSPAPGSADEGGNWTSADGVQFSVGDASAPTAGGLKLNEVDSDDEEMARAQQAQDDDEGGVISWIEEPEDSADEGAGAEGATAGGDRDANGDWSMARLADANPPEGVAAAYWTKLRARRLVGGLLDIEHPIVTARMVEFLLQDGVSEELVEFITRVAASEEEPLPADADGKTVTQDTIRAFRAMSLLANEQPSEALLTFLGRKIAIIARNMFRGFLPLSRGSKYHVCKVLSHVHTLHCEVLYATLGHSPEDCEAMMRPMLASLESPPVGDAVLKIVCPKLREMNQPSLRALWSFYCSLSSWRFILVLAEHVCSPRSSSALSSSAATLFISLLTHLVASEPGKILLQPIGHCPELVGGLIAAVQSSPDGADGYTDTHRQESARVLLSIAEFAGKERVADPFLPPYVTFGGTKIVEVENQLWSCRAELAALLRAQLQPLCNMLLGQARQQTRQANANVSATQRHENISQEDLPFPPMRHSGYSVQAPFTYLRLQMFHILVEILEQNPDLAAEIPLDLWRTLVGWFFSYEHNNLFQALFFRFFFTVLRSNSKPQLQVLFTRNRFLTQLVAAYADSAASPRVSNRGALLRCANAIRLQADTLAPSSYLREYLRSHEAWNRILPVVRSDTEYQQARGLGIPVPTPGDPSQAPQGPLSLPPADENSIDHGSQFATSMGFEGEIAFPEQEDAPPAFDPFDPAFGLLTDDGADSGSKSKSKKKKKKKKKKGAAAAGASADGESTSESEASEASEADE